MSKIVTFYQSCPTPSVSFPGLQGAIGPVGPQGIPGTAGTGVPSVYVTGISFSGSSSLTGLINIVPGSNVNFLQTNSNTFQISSNGGGSSSYDLTGISVRGYPSLSGYVILSSGGNGIGLTQIGNTINIAYVNPIISGVSVTGSASQTGLINILGIGGYLPVISGNNIIFSGMVGPSGASGTIGPIGPTGPAGTGAIPNSIVTGISFSGSNPPLTGLVNISQGTNITFLQTNSNTFQISATVPASILGSLTGVNVQGYPSISGSIQLISGKNISLLQQNNNIQIIGNDQYILTGINAQGYPSVSGAIQFLSGNNLSILQQGNNITFSANPQNQGVSNLVITGSSQQISGSIAINAGNNISLLQQGNNVQISSTDFSKNGITGWATQNYPVISGFIQLLSGQNTTIAQIGNTIQINANLQNAGVTGLVISGSFQPLSGAVFINAGQNISLLQQGTNTLQISSVDFGRNGLTGVGVSGFPSISGYVIFTSGNNISLNQIGNIIQISAVSAYPGVTGFSTSGGASTSGAISISAGQNIFLLQQGNNTQISATDFGKNGVTGINVQGYSSASGNIQFLSGNNTTILQQGNNITISATPQYTLTGISITGGLGLSGAIYFSAGSNISFLQQANNVQISSAAGGGSSSNGITGLSISGGNSISGAISISGSNGILVTQLGQQINISATGDVLSFMTDYVKVTSGNAYSQFIQFPYNFSVVPKVFATLSNTGLNDPNLSWFITGINRSGFYAGFSAVVNTNNYYLSYLSFTGSGYFELAKNSATSTVGVGEINTASSVGGGQSIFSSKQGMDLRFNSISGVSGIVNSLVNNTILLAPYPFSKSITIELPNSGDNIAMFYNPRSCNINQTYAWISGDANCSVNYSVLQTTGRNVRGSEINIGGINVTNTNTGWLHSTFDNPIISGSTWNYLYINSTGQNPKEFHLTMFLNYI